MSMEKGIMYGKEHRRPYYGAKAVSCSCRNHGSCPWCLENRTIRAMREKVKVEIREKAFYQDIEEAKREDYMRMKGVVTV